MNVHLTYKDIKSVVINSLYHKNHNVVKDILLNASPDLREQIINPPTRIGINHSDPLCMAIELNAIEIVKMSLDLGTRIEADNYLLVLQAIYHGKLEILKLFIENGVDLFMEVELSTLVQATKNYYVSCASIIMIQNHMTNILNKYSRTPSKCVYFLMFSCYADKLDILTEFFIQNYPDIERIKYDILCWCSISGNSQVLKYMLDNFTYEEEFIRDLLEIRHTVLLRAYVMENNFNENEEYVHLNILKLFVSGGFELSEIADDLILNSFVSKYFKIIDYLREIKVDMRGALEKIVEKLSKVAL